MNEQAIAPLGECQSDFAIMRQLAATLNRLSPGFSSFPTERNAEEWLDRELKPHLYGLLGITHYQDLRDRYFRVPLPSVPWQDYRFSTPSGKYEFFSLHAEKYGLTPLPIPDFQPSSSVAYPLRFMTIHSYASLNSQFSNLGNLRSLEKLPILYVHPETARLKNLEQGSKVKVYNQLGEIEFHTALSFTIPRDIVVTDLGSASRNYENENANALLRFSETDLGHLFTGYKGISFTNCFVNLKKVE